jgi:hypothetical protein
MLYGTSPTNKLKAKVSKQGILAGGLIPSNMEISSGDAETVRKMYP